jgi:hypothetical protein
MAGSAGSNIASAAMGMLERTSSCMPCRSSGLRFLAASVRTSSTRTVVKVVRSKGTGGSW